MDPLSGKAEEFFTAHSTTLWFTKIGCCDILEMKEQAALELGLDRRELSDTLTKELLDRQRRSTTMAFDYKKEYKALYQPPREPQFVTVPAMTFAAVRGQGDPNDPTGEYKAAIELLYGLLYTIKMSKKGSHRVDGYFDFVVPPLEGLWEQTGTGKESFHWTSMLRLPEFVTREEFDWAVREATAKKKKDFSKVEFFTYDEGLCVQCMHLGSYDDEPETLARMNAFAAEQGYAVDFSETRFHHELYLSDPNRTAPEKRKTILRHPLKSSL